MALGITRRARRAGQYRLLMWLQQKCIVEGRVWRPMTALCAVKHRFWIWTDSRWAAAFCVNAKISFLTILHTWAF